MNPIDTKALHDAAIQAFHREIEASVQKLAAESERISNEKFDWNWWHDVFPELLDDCLRDATLKLDADATDEACRQDLSERVADRADYHGRVI